MKTSNIAILSSGNGSYLERFIKCLEAAELPVVLLASNKSEAPVLDKARHLGLKTAVVPSKGQSREAFEQALIAVLKEVQASYLVLMGFMRILSPTFCEQWPNKIINVHPSLLPKYKGMMDLAVHQAVLDNQDETTGCSVHLVTPAVDEGPVLTQLTTPVDATADCHQLKAAVQALEPLALVEALIQLTGQSDE